MAIGLNDTVTNETGAATLTHCDIPWSQCSEVTETRNRGQEYFEPSTGTMESTVTSPSYSPITLSIVYKKAYAIELERWVKEYGDSTNNSIVYELDESLIKTATGVKLSSWKVITGFDKGDNSGTAKMITATFLVGDITSSVA